MKKVMSLIPVSSILHLLLLLSSSEAASIDPNERTIPRTTVLVGKPTSSSALFGIGNPRAAGDPNSGLTLDACTYDDSGFCKTPRSCYDLLQSVDTQENIPCSIFSSTCVCFPATVTTCFFSFSCEEGERCMDFNGSGQSCVSCDYDSTIFNLTTVDDGAGNCKSSSNPSTSSPKASVPSTISPSPELPSISSAVAPTSPLPIPSQSSSSTPIESSSPRPTSSLLLFVSRTPSPARAPNSGLTLDDCAYNDFDFCKTPRTCLDVFETVDDQQSIPCTISSTTCICSPEILGVCVSSSSCEDGERCMDFNGAGQSCVSCDYDTNLFNLITAVDDGAGKCRSSSSPLPPELEDEDTDPCVAVDSLPDYTEDQLVYPAHRRAAVLCDELNNCATAGHIVSYRNIPMMMKSYCSQSGIHCRRTVKLVNNPRMKRGLRVPSQSEHLQFSAFSARYETFFEEYVIGVVLRNGL